MNQPRSSRRRRCVAAVTAGGVVLLTLSGTVGGAGVANASSHREAPLTAGDPKHDNTDVYAFTSPDKPDTVTLLANWIPFEEPNGGPNFYPWAAGSHYDINIDSQGTGKPDITYRWTFKDVDSRGTAAHGDKAPGTFLYNDGAVKNLTDPTLLFKQTYDLTEIKGGAGAGTVIAHDVPVAPSDVGKVSMPDYATLRDQAVRPVDGGGQVLAGQSADPFFLDLRVFDLLYGANLKEAGHNTLAGYNVNFVALQVPKTALALNADATKNPVVGVWSSTSKQGVSLAVGNKQTTAGDFVQVSRLGNPLVNEVVIPAQLKDAFNGLTPDQDHTVQAAVDKVVDPELPRLIETVYGLPAPAAPRNDIVEIFLTGIAKSAPTLDGSKPPIQADLNSQVLNADGKKGADFVPAEELRLNMGVPVTASPSRLGVLGKDLQGFPNGRRLKDDVIDIELLALEGTAISGKIPAALAAGDGVNAPANTIGSTFPYVALPNVLSVNQAGPISGGMPSGGVSTGGGGTAPRSHATPAVAGLGAVLLLGGAALALRPGRRRRFDEGLS